MKKKNKKNHIKMRFSTLLLCCLVILLCTAPHGWSFSMYCTEDKDGVYCNGVYCKGVYCDEDGEYNVTEQLIQQLINTAPDEAGLDEGELLDMLDVGAGATVNLDTDVSQYVYAGSGSVLNIYSGKVGTYVLVSPDMPYADVTVYGKNFNVSNGTIDPEGKWIPDNGSGILTGIYGNNEPIPAGSFTSGLWFMSPTPIHLKAPPSNDPKEITIDIKPGGNPNNINLNSKGVVPVAVLTTGDFDASTIDTNPDTVKFAGASPVRWRLCDVDDDGDNDLLFHFKTHELQGLDVNSTEATLTCETNNGEVISGTDTVRILSPKKK